MVEKMKVLKNSRQKNVILKACEYTQSELYKMYKSGIIFCLGSLNQVVEFENKYDIDTFQHTFRVPLYRCKELKVIYNREYDFYENVVVTNDGIILPVIL